MPFFNQDPSDQYFDPDFRFYSEIFMKPWFHFNSYFLGVILSLIYIRFLKDQRVTENANENVYEDDRNSFSSRMLLAIQKNAKLRYPLYLLGISLMTITFIGCRPYLINRNNWGAVTQGFYGSFAYSMFALGMALLLVPALIGKAQFIRFFFGGDLWTSFPQMGYGIYLCCPMVCLFYFLSISNALHVDYQMFFYYFCGNFVFTMMFVNILFLFVDRPFTSLLRLSQDLQSSLQSQFKIEEYKLGVILGSDDKMPLMLS